MNQYLNRALAPSQRAKDLVSRMTLREKIGQLNQRLLGFNAFTRTVDEIGLSEEFKSEVNAFGGLGMLYGLFRADPWSGKTYENGLHGALAKKAYNLVQKYAVEHSRFGIPVLMSEECPHGHQALDGYLLPVNLAAGAAWNPSLLERAYRVCGEQLKAAGVHYSLMSMLDVLRDPRWGRSEECYSEDACLASSLAAGAVRGMRSAGVRVVSKHFCAQGETTGGVNASAANIGERELREIHFPPMKACAEAGAEGVMAAYNEIDGVYCHANPWLLKDVLRGEMGFSGIVMADGTAIDNLNALTGDPAASCALALRSGVDIGLWENAYLHMEEAVERGLITEKEVTDAAEKILKIKFETGLFDNPYLPENDFAGFSYDEHPESLEMARESCVLLKNNGILPLGEKYRRIAVIGPNADNIYNQLGDYTPPVPESRSVTPLEGMRRVFADAQIEYAQGCTACGEDESGLDEAVALAAQCDITVLVIGGTSNRFGDVRFDVNGAAIVEGPSRMDCGEGVDSPSLMLPGVQNELVRRISALGKPLVTVVIAGRPYVVTQAENASDALLYAFYPGPMGGTAVAEILKGFISPSGRLPASLPAKTGATKIYYNHKSSYRPMKDSVLHPFGFGLSYTRFEIDNVSADAQISLEALKGGARAQIGFTVKNTGSVDAFAVPQLFISASSRFISRRVKELKAFDKVFLKAGEEKRCKFTLGFEELAAIGPGMKPTAERGSVRLLLEEGAERCFEGILNIV